MGEFLKYLATILVKNPDQTVQGGTGTILIATMKKFLKKMIVLLTFYPFVE